MNFKSLHSRAVEGDRFALSSSPTPTMVAFFIRDPYGSFSVTATQYSQPLFFQFETQKASKRRKTNERQKSNNQQKKNQTHPQISSLFYLSFKNPNSNSYRFVISPILFSLHNFLKKKTFYFKFFLWSKVLEESN